MSQLFGELYTTIKKLIVQLRVLASITRILDSGELLFLTRATLARLLATLSGLDMTGRAWLTRVAQLHVDDRQDKRERFLFDVHYELVLGQGEHYQGGA